MEHGDVMLSKSQVVKRASQIRWVKEEVRKLGHRAFSRTDSCSNGARSDAAFLYIHPTFFQGGNRVLKLEGKNHLQLFDENLISLPRLDGVAKTTWRQRDKWREGLSATLSARLHSNESLENLTLFW